MNAQSTTEKLLSVALQKVPFKCSQLTNNSQVKANIYATIIPFSTWHESASQANNNNTSNPNPKCTAFLSSILRHPLKSKILNDLF